MINNLVFSMHAIITYFRDKDILLMHCTHKLNDVFSMIYFYIFKSQEDIVNSF